MSKQHGFILLAKCLPSSFYSACRNKEYPGSFRNKSVSSSSLKLVYKLKEIERPFSRRNFKEGKHNMGLPQIANGCC